MQSNNEQLWYSNIGYETVSQVISWMSNDDNCCEMPLDLIFEEVINWHTIQANLADFPLEYEMKNGVAMIVVVAFWHCIIVKSHA